LNYKPLRLFLAGHTVAIVTQFVAKIVTMWSQMAEQFFDTMIEASSNMNSGYNAE